MIQGHSEDQCYVKHPELYKDKRTKDVDKDAPTSDKGDKDKSLDKEGKKPDEGFAEPKKKNGGKQNHPPHKKDLVQTKNKFASLNEDKSSATKPNYNEGMDIPKPTEKWVHDAFNKEKLTIENNEDTNVAMLIKTSKQENLEDNDDPHMADSGKTISGGSTQNPHTNEKVEESGKEQIPDNLVSQILETQIMQHHKSENQDGYLEGVLQEEAQLQEEVDGEDGDELDYNIKHISQAGDLSPRHTDNLNGKRGKPKVPL